MQAGRASANLQAEHLGRRAAAGIADVVDQVVMDQVVGGAAYDAVGFITSGCVGLDVVHFVAVELGAASAFQVEVDDQNILIGT